MPVMNEIAKIKEISIVDAAGNLGLHPKKIGRYYTLLEHDSVRIDPEKNIFIRNSTGQGGSVIDFVMVFSGCDSGEAIKMLKDSFAGVIKDMARTRQSRPPKEKTILSLPEADKDMRNVFAYLVKTRCIDPFIVRRLAHDKYLYQDKRKNCVFVGYMAGDPVFASLRGTNTYKKFVGDLPGCDYSVCFFVPGSEESNMLTITESPIDAMSVMNLDKMDHGESFYSDHLAVCGCSKSEKAIINHMSKKKYKSVRLCLDNDPAGIRAGNEICTLLKSIDFAGEIISHIPKEVKDMNDELIGRKKEEVK